MNELADKKTLVLGASLKPERYSNLAIRSLCKNGYSTLAIGLREGEVACSKISTKKEDYKDIHTITMYLGEDNQAPYEEYILQLAPKRVIFNPGAENPSFAQKCRDQDIETINACTLVMLNTGQF